MTGSMTVLRPTGLATAREAMLGTAGRLVISGAGTAPDWGGPLGAVDAVLDTTGLAGVVRHNPGDMTISVLAGTPLRPLQDVLAGHGQRVALDAARVRRGATVGGLVATGDAGPSALAFGTLRDLVIGAIVVLSDGTVSRSGSHVIKNVAGYDLTKLLHGCFGTLGLLVEVILRLHPVPPATRTVAVGCPLEGAARLCRSVLDGPCEPVAVEWCDGRLLVRLEGTERGVASRAQRLADLLAAPVLDEGDAEAAWARHAEIVDRRGDGAAVLRVGLPPSRLPGVVASLGASAVTAGPATGVATLRLPPEAVAAAHAAVYAAGGTSMLRHRPAGCDAPAWGPPPAALPVLASVRRALDPDGRLGPGRFSPWMDADLDGPR